MVRLSLTLCVCLALTAPGYSFPPPAARASTLVSIESPTPGSTVLGEIVITGWAVDPGIRQGTGVDQVRIYLDRPSYQSGVLIGVAEYGLDRPDVAAEFGDPRFGPSGFRYVWQVASPPGPQPLYVMAHSVGGEWLSVEVQVVVDPRAPRYPALKPPGDDDNPSNRRAAIEALGAFQAAMANVTSMREHRVGRLYDSEGREHNLYLYDMEFQAPDRSYQRSTVTTLVDSKEQRIITIGEKAWFWRGGDTWEETFNRSPFRWPGDIYAFQPMTSAVRLADDEIDGRTYRVVEFISSGNEWVGAPGWVYRHRLWIDAETSLPLKQEKAAATQGILGDEITTVTYREEARFFDFNAPITIEPPG